MSSGRKRASLFTAATGVARTLSRTAAGTVLDLASGGLRAIEIAAGSLTGSGIPPAVLRVEVVILSDEQGRPLITPAAVQPALDTASAIFAAHAGIRLRVTGVHTIAEPAPATALDPRANKALLLDDVLGRTRFYRENSSGPALIAVGAPLTVVVVRNITGRTTGCSLGISADWVITQASLFDPTDPETYDETVLAHELGHAVNLPHHHDRANLMFPASSPPHHLRGTALARWQSAVMQANHRVIPGRPPDQPRN